MRRNFSARRKGVWSASESMGYIEKGRKMAAGEGKVYAGSPRWYYAGKAQLFSAGAGLGPLHTSTHCVQAE